MAHLLIDTAFDRCQAGLWRDGALVASLSHAGVAQHDVALAPLVARLLSENGLAVRDLKQVAVVTGPGRFTSLRVGIAFARALVLPGGVPLRGIATGAILRHVLPLEASGWLMAVRRGEMFVQTLALPEPLAVPLDAVPDWLAEHRVTHVAAIGAGVPVDWPSLLTGHPHARILTHLPLDTLGRLADDAAGDRPAGPVRPFYGSSTGAWAVSA